MVVVPAVRIRRSLGRLACVAVVMTVFATVVMTVFGIMMAMFRVMAMVVVPIVAVAMLLIVVIVRMLEPGKVNMRPGVVVRRLVIEARSMSVGHHRQLAGEECHHQQDCEQATKHF